MADANRSETPALSVAGTWKRLNFDQRVAAVGAVLLMVSTLGPFSFVEAAIVLIGLSVLFLLRKRAEGKLFHVPFGDGAVIAAAGAWSGFLIFVRFLDRPLGQNLLAMVCASILLLAGLRAHANRPPDDLPPGEADPGTPAAPPPDPEERVPAPRAGDRRPAPRAPGPADPDRDPVPDVGPAPNVAPAPQAGDQPTAETQALPARVLPPATPQGGRRQPAPPAAPQPPLWDEPDPDPSQS